ncbi:uncharacterized protein LOC111114104 [Crassostrea virginica]
MFFLFRIILSVWLHYVLLVRCICLQDVLSFYDSKKACDLKKEDFIRSIDCLCTCQCYIESIKPSLKENTSYEIEQLTIKFSKKVEIHSYPSCASYFNTDLDVTFNCEGRYYNEREIGDSCCFTNQCKAVDPHSTCHSTKQKCVCEAGYFWNSSKCLKARKLGDSCSDPIQCLTNNPNSTCDQSKNVCRQLLNEVCENYLQSGISNHEQTDIQNNYSTLHPTNVNPSSDKLRTNNTGIIVAVALAGTLFGIAVSASVFFFMIQRLKKSQNRQMGILEDMATRKQNVQVSGDVHVKSRSIVGTNRSNTEENDIYNHLHEDHIQLQDQSDYDHCPPQAAPDDMYSHLDSGHDNSEDYMGDYGEIN